MFSFVRFTVSSFKTFSLLFVSLYKELLEPTFLAFLIVLYNLCGIFKCSVITDFISTGFGFSQVFG